MEENINAESPAVNATNLSTENLVEEDVKKVEEVGYVYGEPENTAGGKRTIVVDEDDPCLKKEEVVEKKYYKTPGLDPRFQQQNQTLRCFVMYTDFYRCEHILGEGAEACTWFKEVFTAICPNAWITKWDDLRVRGLLPWHKYKTQGDFPGNKYSD